MRVHFLDVGQGDATLVEFPCGAILIDTGGELYGGFDGSRELIRALDTFFARRTDLGRTFELVLLTHPHVDHTQGVEALIAEGFTLRRAVTNGQVAPDARNPDIGEHGQRALVAHVPASSRRTVEFATVADVAPRTDAVIDPIDCRPGGGIDPSIRILWGKIGRDPGWGFTTWKGQRRYHFDNENNHSLVVRVDYGASSLLLTGDLEESAIPDFLATYQGGDLLNIDVYQVGHHGSSNGTTAELLTAMSPRVAVISMGPASRKCQWWRSKKSCYTAYRHGHPRQGIVRDLERHVQLRRRQAVEVPVALKQEDFVPQRVEKCVYGTGWTGPVVLTAIAAGWIEVEEPASEPCGAASP